MITLSLPITLLSASLVVSPPPASPASFIAQQDMSFFITSAGPGDGANLGGLAGADKHCTSLADAAGVKGKTWHAYLSQQAVGGAQAIHARDRIGKGPWKNAKGVVVATSVDDLHSDGNKRGDQPNMHDILTGSTLDGRVQPGDGDSTCSNWTSNAETGSASVGHHDRQGGGTNPTSWNFAHPSRGCGQKNLQATGGNGLFYCFAV